MERGPDRRIGIALAIVLALGLVLRFWRLAALPPANYRDVALTAWDGMRAAAGHPCLHYTYDEGLYANLLGLVFLVLGPSDWSLRAPGALFGLLTCYAVYRLGRALGLERAGLYGAGLLAVSLWHVILSRSGFRAVLLPLLLALSIAWLLEALRGGSLGRGAWAGALFGLGIHVYPAVRFAPLILPPLLIAELGAKREAWRRAARTLACFAAAAFVVALPMLLNYLHHPEHFTLPRRLLSVFSPKFDKRLLLPQLERNVLATLLMFHVRGDDNWRHNLAGSPMLDPLTALLLLVGLAAVLRRPQPRAVRALTLSWIGAMLLPNVLSVEGVPHGLRSCGVLPGVALLAGIGMAAVADRGTVRLGEGRARAAALGAILVLGSATAYRYFEVWGENPAVAAAHDGAYRAAARVLLAAPPGAAVFLVANGTGLRSHGQPAEAYPYLFEMRGRPPTLVGPRDAALLRLAGRTALVACIRRDERVLDTLRALNPGAPIDEVAAPGISPESPVYRIN
jgi:4-amino-4-deoxy-L-arabinose transferase-like glycosyltransferase